ncbi:MAG: ABC transporter ATP-binding protein [Ferrimicrobium sp.]
MPSIEVNGVTKQYRSHKALDGVHCVIPEGSVTALVGQIGAGKTTLLRMCAGLSHPDAGELTVAGHSPSQDPNWLSSVSYVDQEPALINQISARRLVEVARKVNLNFDDKLCREGMQALEIPMDQSIRSLSGGQRHGVAVVLALAKRPVVVLLDEPLASLDPVTRRSVIGLLLAYQRESNATILISSHLITDLERVCDRLVLLDHGRVIFEEEIDTMLESHRWMDGVVHEDQGEIIAANGVRSLVRIDPTKPANGTTAGLEEIIVAYIEDLRGLEKIGEVR